MRTWHVMFSSWVIALAPSVGAAAFDISQVDPSVVRIQHVLEARGKLIFGPHGTGFVINDDGYVITNVHVISPPKPPAGIKIRGLVVPDGGWKGQNLRRLRVVWQWKDLDLALLKVENLNRPGVVFAGTTPDESPAKGDQVFAVGFPSAADTSAGGALKSTLTAGVVGKVFVGRGGKEQVNRPVIQHSAGVSPGNSGGPLFNTCNQVAGINTYVATSSFEIKREGGRTVAKGAAVADVYYAPHVASLIKALRARNVELRVASEVCVAAVPRLAWDVYLYVALAGFIAATSLVLALRRPRERVVQVVESYTQMLRRKGGDRKAGGGGTETVGGAGGEVDAVPAWVLSGTDTEGRTVRLVIRDGDLDRGSEGLVIGRQKAQSDLVLADASVSRRHARIVRLGDGIGLEDLGSSNGTRIDGRKLAANDPAPLDPGANLEIGNVQLTLSRS